MGTAASRADSEVEDDNIADPPSADKPDTTARSPTNNDKDDDKSQSTDNPPRSSKTTEASELFYDDDNDNESSSSSAMAGGLSRSALFALRKLGVSTTVVRTAVKKKVFLFLGQRQMITSNPSHGASSGGGHSPKAWPSPIVDAAERVRAAQENHNKASSQDAANNKPAKQQHRYRLSRSSWAGRTAELFKGTLLGVTVFGVYDYLILRRQERLLEEQQQQQTILQAEANQDATNDDTTTVKGLSSTTSTTTRHDDGTLYSFQSSYSWHAYGGMPASDHDVNDHNNRNTTPPPTIPLHAHFQVGALAGLTQSLVLDAWEIGEYWFLHYRRWFVRAHIFNINGELVLRRAAYHSLGYATLFGCYETLRSRLLDQMQQHWHTTLVSESSGNAVTETVTCLDFLEMVGLVKRIKVTSTLATDSTIDHHYYDVTNVPLTVTFVAGGIAGQAHLMVSHYLKQWRIGSHRNSSSDNKSSRKKTTTQKSVHRRPWRHVPARALAVTFLTTGYSFVAFQYAGEMIDRWFHSSDDAGSRHHWQTYL